MFSRHVMFLKFREKHWAATTSQTSTFEASNFLSIFPVACLGPRLLRQNTAAYRSHPRPRFRGPAAPRGEGGRGCGERRRPWPRRGILVGKPHEALGWFWSAWRCWWFMMAQLFGGYCFHNVFTFFWKACQNICTNVWCCCLWTQLYCSYTLGRSFLDSRILV